MTELQPHFAIDLGTTNLSVGCFIGEAGTKPTPKNSAILRLQDNREEVPQIVGFIREQSNWRFVWGCEVRTLERLRGQGRVQKQDLVTFKWLKMCLYPSDQQLRTANEIKKQLLDMGTDFEGYDRDWTWLLELHLREIRITAIEAAQRQFHARGWDPEVLAHVMARPINFIAVPEVSTPNDHVMMMEIITAAGYPPSAGLFYETETAGAWAVERLVAHLPDGVFLGSLFEVSTDFSIDAMTAKGKQRQTNE